MEKCKKYTYSDGYNCNNECEIGMNYCTYHLKEKRIG